jgi:hypothetical protein
MTKKVDKGRSILNATDEAANPYGLILSEEEWNFIYGKLNTLDKVTNSLRGARRGWRPQLKATFITAVEFAVIAAVIIFPTSLLHTPSSPWTSSFFFLVAFLILQKLNLLLTHETIDEGFARRDREDTSEAKYRAQRFKDMGCKDMSLED